METLEKTKEELEEEVRFLMTRILAERSFQGTRWWGAESDALLAWAFWDKEIEPSKVPTTKYAYASCLEMYERAPVHLQRRMAPMLREFKEFMATKEEKYERDNLIRVSGYQNNGPVQHTQGGVIITPTPPHVSAKLPDVFDKDAPYP